MNKTKHIDTKALIEKAQTSENKETCQALEKNPTYRISVGARVDLPTSSSFFVEVVINLSTENGEVNLQRLENTLACLKAMKARGYALTYEDGNCISCETKTTLQNANIECKAIKALVEAAQL